MQRVHSVRFVLYIICLSAFFIARAQAADATDFVVVPNSTTPTLDLGKWRFDSEHFHESSLTFNVGAATITPYTAYADRPFAIDPFLGDVGKFQRGVKGSIPLGFGLSFHVHGFYITPQTPRGISLNKPGDYIFRPATAHREWRITSERGGFSIGPAWRW